MAMQRDAPVTAPKSFISSSPRALQGHAGLGTTSGGGPSTLRGVRGCLSLAVYSLSSHWALP